MSQSKHYIHKKSSFPDRVCAVTNSERQVTWAGLKSLSAFTQKLIFSLLFGTTSLTLVQSCYSENHRDSAGAASDPPCCLSITRPASPQAFFHASSAFPYCCIQTSQRIGRRLWLLLVHEIRNSSLFAPPCWPLTTPQLAVSLREPARRGELFVIPCCCC